MPHRHKNLHRLSPARLFKRRRAPPGTAPGTIVVSPDARPPILTVFAYNGERCVEVQPKSVAEIREHLDKYPVTWVNVDGLGDKQVIEDLGKLFRLHPLALEDVVNTHQRPKVDQYEGNLFIVMRMMQRNDVLAEEQVSIFVGKNFVLTFQENLPGDSFGPVRQRLRTGGPLTGKGADYLAYRLIDAILDSFFPLLEQYGELLETLEEAVLARADVDTLLRVHAIRHDLLALRRAIWPARDAINSLLRDPNALIQSETRLFLRDAYDHTIQLMDLLETFRELGSDLRDLHLTSTSNRLSEIMKVLTIISTIFIPLTFIAGVYGMNFDPDASPWNMPELRWDWGYPATLAVMFVIGVSLLFYFRRRGWLGR
ncbi:MAG: magnesium/cobalt transporter CorA [Pirellulales bacterium]